MNFASSNTQTPRMSWDEFFATQSRVMSFRSTCARLAVGCVIVRDKRIVASGYNGSLAGDVHCIDVGCKMEDGHCIRAIHAEQNALLQCAKLGIAVDGSQLYVTHRPCLNCTKSLIQAGIREVCFEFDYRPNTYAIELLEKAGVQTRQVQSRLDILLQAVNSSASGA